MLKFIVIISISLSCLFSQTKTNLDYLIFSLDTPKEKLSLEDASNYCDMLTLYGLSDWQLPNDKELSLEKNRLDFWSSDDNNDSNNNPNTLRKALCVHQKPTPKECFKFDKKSFKESLKTPHDVIVEANELKYESKDNHSIYISFAPKDIENAKEDKDFSCENEESGKNYLCYSEEDRGEITTYLEKERLYIKINRIDMSDDLEGSIANSHYIKSLNDKFSIGEKIACENQSKIAEIKLEKTLEDELLNASRRGDVQGVLSALDKGANIDAKDNHNDTALSSGIEHFEVVKLLLNYDATIELEGDSMLRIAIENGDLNTLQILFDYGLKPSLDGMFSDISKDGNFELEELFIRGDNNIVRLLLKNGADVDIKDKNGYSLIDKALLAKDIILFRTLIKYHAQIDESTKAKICKGYWIDGCAFLQSIK